MEKMLSHQWLMLLNFSLSISHINFELLLAVFAVGLVVCLCFSFFGLLDMAEGTKVRVVRCPKCENLLPELPDYTVYRCGGCGTVLRAKKQTSIADGSPEKSDEERPIGNSGEKEAINLSDASGTDRESDGPELEHRKRRPIALSERVASSNATSSSRPENREVVSDNHGGGVETMVDKESKYRYSSKAPAEDWVVVSDQEMNLNGDELANVQMGKEAGEAKSQTANASRPWGSRQTPDKQSREFWRTPGVLVEDVRFSTLQYPDEGPSNYHRGSSYGFAEPVKNHGNLDGPSRVEYLEQDRAELLRKLDELKDQLSRSCDMAEKPEERVPAARRQVLPPLDPYGGHGTWPAEGLPGPSRASMPSYAPDKHIHRPPYVNHVHEPIPLMNRHHLDVHQQNFHPPLHTPNEIPGFGDPFGPQMLRRAPHQTASQYSQRSSHEYFSGCYMDVDSDPMAVYPHNSFFEQAACSCLHCYNKHWQIPGQIPPPVFKNRRYPDVPTSSMFNHLETSVPFGSRGYNPRAFNPPVYPREAHEHARRPSPLDSDMGGFNRVRPQRVVLANGHGRRFRPIAGGAPFITCHNCFELLRLPKKLLLMERNEWKVQCGACSTVIPIVVESKRLLVSVPAEIKQTPLEVHGGSSEVVKGGLSHNNGYTNEAGTNSYSDDYDNSNYFKFTDPEHSLLAEDHRSNLSESEKVHSLLSSSSSPSDDESSDSLITRREMSNTTQAALMENMTPPVPGSPLQEYHDHPPVHVVSKLEKGSRSIRLDQEKVILGKVTFRQDSLKDASVATEMEVSFDENLNTGLSQDSVEASKEKDQPRVKKGGESFFAGLVKKSFRELSRSDQTVENGKANVFINGHPIPDRSLRKAEKLAGPIHPGQYWYDFQAGFWGVMGRPCLGIIPPYIEEFNFPIPENCAGGNTGVFVNGRELHQKDLELLAGRGLPTTRDKSYVLDISGRVLDEDTEEELDSLGRLAPTIEKAKHGFGMRAPRVARTCPSGLNCMNRHRVLDSTVAPEITVPVKTPTPVATPEIVDHIPSSKEKCDIFTGDWIPNPSGPIYTNETCHVIEDHQNCMKNGRPDSGYLNWRWIPRDCELPPFSAERFLELMRHKSWALVGDSISRNYVQSFLCVLSKVEKAVEVFHEKDYKSRRWHFPSYNFTLSVIWSPFLLHAATFEDINGVATSEIQLYLDKLDKKWTDQYQSFDYIIISGGKWFLKTAIYYENNTIVGCHYCPGKNLTEMGFEYAYRKALQLMLNFIVTSNHKGLVLFRTSTSEHFENGEWFSGGTCNRTKPFKEGEIDLKDMDIIFRNIELEEYEKAAAALGSDKELKLKLMDISLLSLLRPDGHPGPYRYPHPFADGENAKVVNDCLHWCLPGPIDAWNDLVMELVVNG
ncbi:hypothetical protein NE237_012255 [Protea cynaroides]|uniref:Uncharacterized protein n=1 Tax=Protea cynaroides TaxID=273540 RepID=A0A9Q0JXU5_9MAGN|nr:hypothetical protein NE237_012255 [Protea cynaroides]